MLKKQQKTFHELEKKIYARGITRRDFLAQTVGMGLTSSAALFLESCDALSSKSSVSSSKNRVNTASDTGPINIEWESEHDSIGTYSVLVSTFNKINKHGIHVTLLDTSSDKQHDELVTRLRARQGSPDIISMDIIWTDEFAENGWVMPLDDLWPVHKRNGYLSTPMDGATYQGRLWAAPFRTDVGLLYYRTDRIATPPTSWSELVRMAQQTDNEIKHGYVWQGKQYEGLVCDFVEVLSGYGGNILDPHDPTRVVVKGDAARQALSEMKSWIGTISPSDITLYDEDRSDAIWNSGDALFMRNWPTYIAVSNNVNNPKVAQKFGITTLPSGMTGINARSCLGGWGLAINAFSKKQDAAWEFIQWMLQEDAQKFAAIDASFTVTLESVYRDQYVLTQNPFYEQLPSIIKQAQLRPRSPFYPAITQAIQGAVYNALTGYDSIERVLEKLQRTLQDLV